MPDAPAPADPRPPEGGDRRFLTLDELPLPDLTNWRPSLWWRVRSGLRWRVAQLCCALFHGHVWETHGGRYWTDCGWDYDSHTECARCGASGDR